MSKIDGEPDRKILARFVEDHFTLENQLEEFEPQDWTDEPSILDVISGNSSSIVIDEVKMKRERGESENPMK